MSKMQLGRLVTIKTGKLDVNAGSLDGAYPFFTCSKDTYKINSYSYDCKCVLVAGNGDLNVKYYEGKFDAYQRTYIIESLDEAILNTKYLYWYLYKYVEKLRQLSIGGVIKYIKLNNLTDPEIPLLSLNQQQHVVNILDQADALRSKRKQAIDLLDEYIKSVFLGMFGNPVTNPKGWEVKQLSEILDFMTSGSRGWAKYYSDNGSMFLTIKNVGRNSKLNLEDVTFVIAPENAESKRTKVREGDVLLSITADLGRTAVVEKLTTDAYINQHLAILRLKDWYVPHYVSHYLSTEGGQMQIQKLNKGASKSGLNFEDIKSLKILLPPIQLQHKFVKAIRDTENLKQKMLTQSGELENQFQALMQKHFSIN